MYSLSKIHKPLFNIFPKLRPILSVINTATYGWAKFFVPLRKCFTMNQYTLKDSSEFAKDITNQNSNCFMASLDVDSLFTNVPLDETIKICIDGLFKSDMTVSGLNKKEMFEIISLTLKESVILFDNKYYSQIDGVAMGSPLGPTLTNIFLCYHESNWLKDCPKNFKPIYYKRNVDDIFVLFIKPEHALLFLEYINKKHKNIKFSIETELNGSLSFLDFKIFRENEKFVTSVFRKDTFSGVCTNFISFIPHEYKFGLVHTLLNRCFNLSSDFLKFHHEVDKLKKSLSKNGYSQKFVDKCIQKLFYNMYIKMLKVPSVSKKELIIILPYLGNMSQIVKTKLTKTMSKHMKFCKLIVIFQTNNRLKNYFRFKGFVPEALLSSLIYKASYIGKTYRHYKVRVSEHQGVSPRTGKPVKGILSTSVRDHMLVCDHKVVHEDFKFLGNESNRYLVELKESLFIKRDTPSLDKNLYSEELLLF